MKLFSFTCTDAREPHEIYAPLSRSPYSLFFDSADRLHELSRYSFIAFEPFEIIESKDGRVRITSRDQRFSFEASPFEVLRDRIEFYSSERETRDDLPPFQGGAAGFFGYDLVRGLERLPDTAQSDPAMPDMAIGMYDQVYAYDHHRQMGLFMVHAPDEQAAQTRFRHFQRLIAQPVQSTAPQDGDSQWHAGHNQKSYEAAVRKVIDYIYAGDIFQANLSQRFEADLPPGFDSWDHYLTLRSVNAAPFAGYMNFGNIRLASASPERFLSVENRQVETRPIKGTLQRHRDYKVDQFYRNQLENSAKDRAENIMIVDLLRNDLSKVCEDNSIQVQQLCALESFAKVHHLVSIISGTLRADSSPAELLQACFPGGSITGAPKIRAMEIIEELEPQRRGPYCGSMGYMGFNGAMDTNIVIRTLVYNGNKICFNVGGGIVADSDPAAEYDETLVKAEALFRSFEEYEPQQAPVEAKA